MNTAWIGKVFEYVKDSLVRGNLLKFFVLLPFIISVATQCCGVPHPAGIKFGADNNIFRHFISVLLISFKKKGKTKYDFITQKVQYKVCAVYCMCGRE